MQVQITIADLVKVLLTMPQDRELPVDQDSGFITLDLEVIEPKEVNDTEH
jgi:hypothetical protein